VSFLTKLFSSHRVSESSSSVLVSWCGESGTEYEYEVYPLNTVFRSLPGNFIYAKQDPEGGWIPIYIAQTRDLHQRLEGHVSLQDAVGNGATHLHAHYCSVGQGARCSEERDLILRYHPVCNDQVD